MRTIHLPKGTIMFKNPWINIAIQFSVKFVAFFVIRTIMTKALADLIERRPDPADMHTTK